MLATTSSVRLGLSKWNVTALLRRLSLWLELTGVKLMALCLQMRKRNQVITATS